uniref:Peptidase S1 domain-containing protein n=1 Tax=Phasianus colchicus TaxID=9054 RepID=A0A669QQG5_PHACC
MRAIVVSTTLQPPAQSATRSWHASSAQHHLPSECHYLGYTSLVVASSSVPDCGLTTALAFSKIVGGSSAARGEWPWQVSLWLRQKEHKCGAVLIADRWLLSAAHCFDIYSDPKMWVAFLGTPFLNGNDGKMEKIFRIYKHPFYNVYSLDYDVALLELSMPVRFSSTIKPICLPDNSHIFQEGARCFITGWGSTKEGGLMTKHLQKAAVNVIGDQDCKKFYPVQISSRMVCAGFPQGTVDSCSGDAGGPLACKEHSGRWFLAGITSWGYGCARPYFPGVYTKVTAVQGWIAQNLNETLGIQPAQALICISQHRLLTPTVALSV